ncbi:hypothetical protein MferCBS31731_004129, partial [Microsporum ferrugineum]
MSNPFYTTHSVTCNDRNSPATDQSHLLSAAAVSNQRKAVLSTYISEAKAFFEPRVAVTNDELDAFLKLVFTDWTTEEPCYPPNKKDADAAFGDKHVRVGTLSRDLPTTEATNASRLRAEKHR